MNHPKRDKDLIKLSNQVKYLYQTLFRDSATIYKILGSKN